MKKLNIIKVGFLSVVISLFSSCSSDYLDTLPTNSMGKPTIFENTENAKLAINGICKAMTQQIYSQGLNGEGTIKMYYGNYAGNHFSKDFAGWASIINFTFTNATSSTYTTYPWFYYYRIIGNANSIIVNIDKVTGSDADKQFIKAQALTFRAYAYLMLSQLYCNRWSDSNNGTTEKSGLPLRLDESNGDLAPGTLLAVYTQIYRDLDDAIANFKATTVTRGTSYWEPNINVAYATYARAAITRKDYDKAATYAPLARTGYPLMSNKDYQAGFCKNNGEWIWGSYGSTDETLYFYSFQSYMAYNSSASVIRSYPNCISKELFDQMSPTDIRRANFLDPAGNNYSKTNGAATKKDYLTLYNLGFAKMNERATASGLMNVPSTSMIYAYMQYKFGAIDMPGVGCLNHFRSSEMYLIEAEANALKSTPDETAAIAALTALIKDSGRDANYTCTATGAALFAEIKKQRAIELWGEGFDWFDMKRWGDSINRKTFANGGNYITALALTITPEQNNKWTWMVPLKETDYNHGY